jgi:hypothetical protein
MPEAMRQAPERLVEYLRESGYHSRSNKHSNALMRFIVDDLVRECADVRYLASKGELVFSVNHNVHFGNEAWNIDLALGPPTGKREPVPEGQIREAKPSAIRIAIEGKAIMTKHQGARKNRRRDIGAFRDYLENSVPDAVRGAVTILNASPTFRSKVNSKVNVHPNISGIVETTVSIFRNVPLRNSNRPSGTVDAISLIVVDFDGLNLEAAKLVTKKPAPLPGEPCSYDQFIQGICDAFHRQFGAGRTGLGT